ncbi:sucraseferredoxin family protein (plasmid) [Deinococcus sp. KNUC1210]|uniref:sucrase ferredoxin n=1 Tax=Deinococcus sp. KNUC1210 TaxID=2917691 RepID=UPI001EEF8D98|nr:sucrase ferredoxin [Deinococcus sp. KNUC1210]ULH17640.1 sucraseferredoxin family protein [Deinococcus sp. KNUC1210]
MTSSAQSQRLPLCSEGQPTAGVSPRGSAHRWDLCFVASASPRRWDAFRDASRWSERQRAVMAQVSETVAARQLGYGLLMYAPNDQHGDRQHVRVYRRPPGAFAAYTREDYVFDDSADEDGLLSLIERDLLGLDRPELDRMQVVPAAGTDLHVCTHGRVDAACGKFGVPLYQALQQAGEQARIWRTSHFGGHRFAPTVQELPAGRAWAHLTPALTRQLLERTGDHTELSARYRGWSALSALEQQAEAAAFEREGWWWLDVPKTARTLLQSETGAVVELAFTDPDGRQGQLTADVRQVDTLALRSSSHTPDTHSTPQYRVSWLR